MKENQKQIDYCSILTTNTKEFYDKIGTLFCPCLNENVTFNAKGFHHLLYEPIGTPRDIKERIHKLILFPLAVPVIKNAKKIDEERTAILPSRKKLIPPKKAKYTALVVMVGKNRNVKVKVILLKIGNGKLIFWSIMRLTKGKNNNQKTPKFKDVL